MSVHRISRVLVLGALSSCILFAVGVALASAGVLEASLQRTREQGRQVKQEMRANATRQQSLERLITATNARLRRMQGPVDQLDAEVNQLDARIESRRMRIKTLQADFERQAREIERLDIEHDTARTKLEERVVAAYMGDDPSVIQQLASAGSLRDLFERQEALGQVVGLDRSVIVRIGETQRAVRLKRASNHALRARIRGDIASLEYDRARAASARSELQRKVDEVAAVKRDRDAALRALQRRRHALDKKLDDLEADAKAIKEAIETGTVSYGGQVGTVSPAGLIWPVLGPVVSPFGPRWGRMHEGIDIAIAAGNPIHAAASGVVTYASWMSGYGNMVLIQHGGGLVTGYAHQSKIAVSVGQPVTQGQVIGFVGCTGRCFGDHVHFETRYGTTPHDPMRDL